MKHTVLFPVPLLQFQVSFCSKVCGLSVFPGVAKVAVAECPLCATLCGERFAGRKLYHNQQRAREQEKQAGKQTEIMQRKLPDKIRAGAKISLPIEK